MSTFYGNVLVRDKEIIAAIMGYIRMYAKRRTYYIEEFFISNSYKRRGYSSKLYKFSIDQLKKDGVGGAFFTTLKNTSAYNFYIKQGAWELTDSASFYHKF